MRTFVSSGHNITTPVEMKTALDANSGVAGCQVAVVRIDRSKQTLTTHKWKGVNAITNIKFTEVGIQVFKAFGIGAGHLITNNQLNLYSNKKQAEGGIIVDEDFCKPKQVHGMISDPTRKNMAVERNEMTEITDEQPDNDASNADEFVFCCPEMGCTRKFLTFMGMERHTLLGKHKLALQKESSYDKIKIKWSNYCNNLNDAMISTREFSQTRGDSFETCLLKGWALKKEKSCKRLDANVKEYLAECYNKGEVTEQKASAKDVAELMKYKKDSNGKPLFTPDQWLQPSQVISFFSRQSCLKSTKMAASVKQEKTDLGDDNDDDDDDDDDDLNAVVAAIEADNIRSHVHSLLQ